MVREVLLAAELRARSGGNRDETEREIGAAHRAWDIITRQGTADKAEGKETTYRLSHQIVTMNKFHNPL
jgi:hypothetical protein